MKKIFTLFIVALLVMVNITPAYALYDLSAFSDEDLQLLELDIQAERISRGTAKYAEVSAGTYTIGYDIPAGSYSIKGKNDKSFVYQIETSSGGFVDSQYLSSGESVGKVVLENNQVISFDTAVIMTVYSGAISFVSDGQAMVTKNDATQNVTAAVSTPAPAVSSNSEPTMGEKNALKNAQSYLSLMGFSYSGLIEQLEFAGYTSDEAKYAADNCGADWNEQAARSAQSYLSLMSFSQAGLIEQLEFAGYTHEQAVYGAHACGY